ncbi:MAG TPA: hypothetical protein VNA89_03710, partial [Gemmatimonadaceae bacterium]|nr:hypothetical protein [Gemmatimonadaceae bacterium]
MSDERFEQRLGQAARDYHAPGEVPRDAMWAAIDAARRGQAGAAPPAPRRRPVARVPWLAAAGIAAVLAIGVAIGRWTARLPGGALPAQGIAGVPTAGDPAVGDTMRPTELPHNVAARAADAPGHRPDRPGSGVARRAARPDAAPTLARAPRGRSASAAERV